MKATLMLRMFEMVMEAAKDTVSIFSVKRAGCTLAPEPRGKVTPPSNGAC
jgi:hypothetical protein